jgi:adenosine deaminase
VRYIASINRSAPIEYAQDVVELALRYRNELKEPYLVGVELSGDPRTGDFKDFESILVRAKEGGLKISLHCAEQPE